MFKIGDKVRVKYNMPDAQEYGGKEGIIIDIEQHPTKLKKKYILDVIDRNEMYFFVEELEKCRSKKLSLPKWF